MVAILHYNYITKVFDRLLARYLTGKMIILRYS